jgi:hypothetical protein
MTDCKLVISVVVVDEGAGGEHGGPQPILVADG